MSRNCGCLICQAGGRLQERYVVPILDNADGKRKMLSLSPAQMAEIYRQYDEQAKNTSRWDRFVAWVYRMFSIRPKLKEYVVTLK